MSAENVMRKCIWCLKSEAQEDFFKKAHTIPQSLGGVEICQNVCDRCNAFFGSPQQSVTSVETALKEGLAISKFHILNSISKIGRGSKAGRYKSIYFNVNFSGAQHVLTIKPAYSVRPHFQAKITSLFKRGLYKIFLEESERQRNNALESRFDFIREYARYGLGDYPVLHFERKFGALLIDDKEIVTPKFRMDEKERTKYLLEEYGFFEFEILGHLFAIATSKLWELTFDIYRRKSLEAKVGFFHKIRFINDFNDIDPTLKRAFDFNIQGKPINNK